MKTLRNFGFGIIAVALLFALWWSGTYNNLVTSREDYRVKMGKVANAYQRRADLIPNLVAIVKGYAAHEEKVFKDVDEATAKIGSINIKEMDSNPEVQKKFLEAQTELKSSLGRLIAIGQAFPQLKANENFLALQQQLEGSENRIATERGEAQVSAGKYNMNRQGFFSSYVANHYGFTAVEYYEPKTANAEIAPKIEF